VTELLSRLQDSLSDRHPIERRLGAGGMAQGLPRHDLPHDRPVALKAFNPALAAVLGDRFLQEIRVAARLSHILTVHDSGEAGGLLWYTMPVVDGVSLRQRLEREGQPADADGGAAVSGPGRVILQVCSITAQVKRRCNPTHDMSRRRALLSHT
jgi:serine/threonine protein kinase